MFIDKYGVEIPQGRALSNGYVAMQHSDCYTILITNRDYQRRCDAEVEVDGKVVGNFRVNAGDKITLERPSHDTGKFTFYKADTNEAHKAGVDDISFNDRGLVKVTFRPERYTPPPPSARSSSYETKTRGLVGNLAGGQHTNCTNSYSYQATCGFAGNEATSAGMTGLSGKSDQSFHTVAKLNYDPSLETVITLRLVHDDERAGPRPLTPATPRGNPVPAPV